MKQGNFIAKSIFRCSRRSLDFVHADLVGTGLALTLCLFTTVSCTHSSDTPPEPQSPVNVEPPTPSDARSAAGSGATTSNVAADSLYAKQLQDDLRWLQGMTANSAPVSKENVEKAKTLAVKPTRHFLDNALLSHVAVHMTLHGQTLNGEIDKAPTLEMLTSQLDIKLVQSMERNPLLQQPRFFTQVLQALERTPNSPAFDAGVRKTISKVSEQWQEFLQSQVSANPETPAAVPQSDLNADANAKAIEESDPNAITGDDAGTEAGSTTVSQAEQLAARGEHLKAIQLLARARADDPAYQVARERIVQYSNEAVQDLRTKSASEFQNAQQVPDNPGARLSYLKKSQSYLQAAVQDFPDATMIATVRSNLDFVNREIAKIESRVKP